MDLPVFTHIWHSRFGWERTNAKFTDFKYVELLGENDEGKIWLAWTTNGLRYILRTAISISK